MDDSNIRGVIRVFGGSCYLADSRNDSYNPNGSFFSSIDIDNLKTDRTLFLRQNHSFPHRSNVVYINAQWCFSTSDQRYTHEAFQCLWKLESTFKDDQIESSLI